MQNTTDHAPATSHVCTSCGTEIHPDTRAVVFSPACAYCGPCWTAIVVPPVVTAVERRMGRNWPTVGRCRLSA